MEFRLYYYEVAMRRKKQDLYLKGLANFIVEEDGEVSKVISTQPPWMSMEVPTRDVERVINRWWELFIQRMQKFAGSKTIVRGIKFELKDITKKEEVDTNVVGSGE